jgi:TolB-like protein
VADGNANVRQAAIVSVDVFGFARDTEEDRQKVTQAFEALNARLESTAERHNGRVFYGAADGLFLELPSADEAVVAGEEIANGPWPPVRVGVHQGPVAPLASGELEGDAISTVARIQQAADKGDVLVSEDVKRAIRAATLSKRLSRDAAVRPDRGQDLPPVYKLSFVQPVDHVALHASNRRRMLILLAVTTVVLGAVAIFFGRDIYTTLFPKHDHVAVLRLQARGGGNEGSDVADSLTDEIAYVLGQGQIPTVVGPLAETLRGPDKDAQARRYQVGAVLDGTVSGGPETLDVSMRIIDPISHRTLWTHAFHGSGEDLQTQVSSRVINVLTCSAQAMRPGAHVSGPDIVALYIRFCDLNSDAASDANALVQLENTLRELTAKAPEFSYGHSNLALFLISKSQIDPDHAPALLAEAGREADRTIALDPKNADGYVARARLVTPPGWAAREKDLALAVGQRDAGPVANAFYTLMLQEVGRLNDAAIYSQRAASEVTSGDPDYVILIASSLAFQGKDDAADSALTKALQIAPNNPVIQTFRFHMYEWLGRWDEALAILNDDESRPPQLEQEDDLAATRSFIAAMLSGDAGSRIAARNAEFASVGHDRAHLMAAMSHLSALGMVDDAYRLADQVPPSPQTDDLSVLFTPLNAAMRRDPRFIALAGKLGLVAYWKASGAWPDFCAASDLGYDCRAQAQKVTAS